MLPGNPHFLCEVRQRERGRPTFEPVVAVLPGDPIKDDCRKLVCRGRERRFRDATQNGAGGEFHDVSFRLGTTPDRKVQNFVPAKAFAG